MKSKELNTLLKKQIEKQSFLRDIEFALNICNRLLPDYVDFSKNNEWGEPDKLLRAINFCEKNKLTLETDEDEVIDLKEELESVTPDTDDFGDWDGSYALNSVTAILELLEYYLDKDKAHILNISSSITDTIDFKLNEEEDNLSDEQLSEHPKVIEELLYQIELTK
ncbi:DUF416 family protein [Runella sp. CRIBMP]|uniref:DUF416 family protein n=1 Tax=Runella sp. CRIBMP TaxID=2683261 RepID=UPI001413312B|nr:DUF416 family protein [Runella sp. CRIBMP]NBB18626.1 DUF416 family protein [Runella sp. CRIBMP]